MTISISTSMIRKQAESLETKSNKIKMQLQDLQRAEQNLGSMWDGPSKQSFDATFKNNYAEYEKFKMMIDQYAAKLRDIASEYERIEKENEQIARDK
ncbi:MAG: WXG100 family type VII secretion target [Eubacteriales bacterium]|nr:WXG100 family type VII secretion target [Eubacteriales bacterium]